MTIKQSELEFFIKTTLNLYEQLKESYSQASNIDKKHHIFKILECLKSIDTYGFEIREVEANKKSVCCDLEEYYDNHSLKDECSIDIYRFLMDKYSSMNWQYGYKELPNNIKDKFAFTEIVGKDGFIASEEISLGYVLLSKDTNYPDHYHRNVDELYINLGADCKVNGKPILCGNNSYLAKGEIHNIESNKYFPSILLYSWTGMSGSTTSDNLRFT